MTGELPACELLLYWGAPHQAYSSSALVHHSLQDKHQIAVESPG